MAQKRRIFLADPRDLNSHSCHKTTKLRQTDSVYLICEEATKEPLPDYLRDFFSDKQVFVHTEDFNRFSQRTLYRERGYIFYRSSYGENIRRY